MKPKKPLPTTQPFLTILTRTYCRPEGLIANIKSVYQQTIAHEIEQIIIPDHIGVAPHDAVYGCLPNYVDAIHGEYVHVLGDDDVLADRDCVASLKAFARQMQNPPVIVVRCKKGDTEYPKCGVFGVPAEGEIDLCNYVIRADVFKPTIYAYGGSYDCDWGFLQTLDEYLGKSGIVPSPVLFAVGAVGGGRPEAVNW